MLRNLAAAVFACACLLVAPAIASAATAGVSGGVLYYSAAPGEANNVTITPYSNSYYVVTDNGASALTATSGCSVTGTPNTLHCTLAGTASMSVDLGDQNDTFNSFWALILVTVHGGTGDDTITGGGGSDHLYGDAGNDTLNGELGNNYMEGGPGTDTINGWNGNDTINVVDSELDHVKCSGGTDTVQADAIDDVATDCENVTRGSTGTIGTTTGTDPGTTTGTAGDPGSTSGPGGTTGGYGSTVIPAPIVQIVQRAVTYLQQNGNLTLHLKCPSEIFDGCEGTVTLQVFLDTGSSKKATAARRRKLVKLATRHFKIAAGRSSGLVVHMSRRGRRTFQRQPRRKLLLTTTMKTATGVTTSTRTIVVQRRVSRSYASAPGARGRHR